MRALGSIITTAQREPTVDEIYCCLFDYYDHWDDIDPRLKEHHDPLSHAANLFAHDLVNLSAYAQEVLHWLQPRNLRSESAVVVVGALAEAFITSARSTCDGLSVALSYAASEKRGQAPSGSLRALLEWAKKNPHRVAVSARPAFGNNYDWFWRLRSLRDNLIHKGATPTVHCDGRQFNLWLHSAHGWITREPLLPMLASLTQSVLDLGQQVSEAVNRRFPLPLDRHRTRMLQGITVRCLHRLVDIAPEYAVPSP